MALKSNQYAGNTSSPRVKAVPQDLGNSVHSYYGDLPAGVAQQAINEIIELFVIPAGTRLTPQGKVSCSAGTASCTLDIGIKALDGTVIDATGIATGINAAAAGIKDANNGTFLAAGIGYITTQDVVVYATVKGAVLAAAQRLAFYIEGITGF